MVSIALIIAGVVGLNLEEPTGEVPMPKTNYARYMIMGLLMAPP